MDLTMETRSIEAWEFTDRTNAELSESLKAGLLLHDNQNKTPSPVNSVPLSSGYCSPPENTSPQTFTPPQSMMGDMTGGIGGRKIPIWSNSLRTADKLPYHFVTTMNPVVASELAVFHLKAGQWTTDDINVKKHIKAVAVHSTGIRANVNIAPIEDSMDYQCCFTPLFTGRYSVQVITEGDNGPYANASPGAIGAAVIDSNSMAAPLELIVARNYVRASEASNVPSIKLDPNSDKYWGIAFDDYTNHIYVPDRQNNEIIIVDPIVGKVLHKFGWDRSFCSELTNLYRPTGMTVDHANKRLIISDKDNNRISFFTLDGHYISSFGKTGHGFGEFNYPWDVDISDSGNVIAVTDSRNHRIQFFDRYGNYLSKFSVFDTNPYEYKHYFDYPRGLAFDKQGKYLYCTDFHTNNVVSLCVDTMEARLLAPPGKMFRPQGITVDEMGQLIVCDSRRNCVRVMSTSGELSMTVNKVNGDVLDVPTDVCVTRWGQTIVNTLGGKIHIF